MFVMFSYQKIYHTSIGTETNFNRVPPYSPDPDTKGEVDLKSQSLYPLALIIYL